MRKKNKKAIWLHHFFIQTQQKEYMNRNSAEGSGLNKDSFVITEIWTTVRFISVCIWITISFQTVACVVQIQLSFLFLDCIGKILFIIF